MGIATNVILNIGIGLVPDALLCWAYASMTDGGWRDFFIAFAVLQALYFFLWAKTAAWQWLLFWIYGKRALSRSMEKFFRESNFPAPRSFDDDIDDYLSGIVDDEAIVHETRIKASFELGTLNGLKTAGRTSVVWRLFSASKSALNRYARYAPKRLAYD